jgi:UPF0755 protein
MVAEKRQAEPPAQESEKFSSENTDRNRQKIISVLFFSFFFLLWLILYFLNREIIRTGSTGDSTRLRYAIVKIEPGSSVSQISAELASRKLISSELLFKAVAVLRGTARRLKAGEYRFDYSMSLVEILTWLEQGHVMLHRFTVPEGFTVEEIAELLDEKGLATYDEVLQLANDEKFCREVGVQESTLEGFLFPDTYRMARGLTAKQVLRTMVERFWYVWRSELVQCPGPIEADLHDIVSIASIIEKEAVYNDEEPLVASVIYNRLNRNMRLQCDVTIRYPLDNYGTNLTYADLHLDSPYNSYIYKGLPPTPICSPGRLAIRAALNPPKTDYLYFVSMNNRHHKFSATLREHNEAVHKYQILNEVGK